MWDCCCLDNTVTHLFILCRTRRFMRVYAQTQVLVTALYQEKMEKTIIINHRLYLRIARLVIPTYTCKLFDCHAFDPCTLHTEEYSFHSPLHTCAWIDPLFPQVEANSIQKHTFQASQVAQNNSCWMNWLMFQFAVEESSEYIRDMNFRERSSVQKLAEKEREKDYVEGEGMR